MTRTFQSAPDPENPPRFFYVTCIEDGPRKRVGWLAGPYERYDEALARVQEVRKLAENADPRAAWYAFGTAGAEEEVKTVFGRVQPEPPRTHVGRLAAERNGQGRLL